MTDPVPSKDALPQVTLTPEQEKRASELAVAMSMSYWGLRSAACVIVGLQDEVERLRTALRGISTCSTCEACRGAARLALGEQPPPLPELNWMPFEAGVKFLGDRLMTVDSSWLLKHWDCKYLDVRVDMRTGAMLVRPGNSGAEQSLDAKIGALLIGRGFYDRMKDQTDEDTAARIVHEFLEVAKPILSAHYRRAQPPGDGQ